MQHAVTSTAAAAACQNWTASGAGPAEAQAHRESRRRCDQISVFKIKRRERELCRAPHEQQHQPHRPAQRPCADACRRRKGQRKQRREQPGTENDREHPKRQHIHDRRGKRDSSKLKRRNGQREDHGRDRAAERRQHGAQKRAENRFGAQQARKELVFRKAPVKSARKEDDPRRRSERKLQPHAQKRPRVLHQQHEKGCTDSRRRVILPAHERRAQDQRLHHACTDCGGRCAGHDDKNTAAGRPSAAASRWFPPHSSRIMPSKIETCIPDTATAW